MTIDQLRLGAKLNLYGEAAAPQQAVAVPQPNSARSATALNLRPQAIAASLSASAGKNTGVSLVFSQICKGQAFDHEFSGKMTFL